ncbi:hypothetical protein PHA77_17845 (plasmid) [Edwardsiella tarda]|uniref:hypothetical protein n=1 Tax=Edwardsiella tarda TaxID=636 RepID=UPI002443F579|nr:hypothetical protein [Edwardsiella tarda]WGE30954.1 hypothetical protein PHA77_17845 [Edwardsiella tarda]
MTAHKDKMKEIKDDVTLSLVSGSGGFFGYNPGPIGVWGGIMGGLKPCSWPAPFYGPNTTVPTGVGLCSHR